MSEVTRFVSEFYIHCC